MNSEKFLATASRLALEAGRAVMALSTDPISKRLKEDRSLVTEADLRSDKILREGLQAAFPGHAILTEESGISGSSDSEWIWVIDPLDGTRAFAKKIPGFAVMVGLLKEDCPFLGVVVDPLQGLLYDGVKGAGAFLTAEGQRKPLHVSKRDKFSEMPLVVSTGCPSPLLNRIRGQLQCPVLDPVNSVGIKSGRIVRQVADIYFSHHPVHFWDTCAPQVILEEAGGIFTGVDGGPFDYDLVPGRYEHAHLPVASNGTRHRELCELFSSLKYPP